MSKIANLTFLLSLLLSSVLGAQSVIGQAVKETINLAPRVKKGDLQRYWLEINRAMYGEDDSLNALKTDYLAFSQVCTGNTPESGLSYSMTIDSLLIGQYRRPNEHPPQLHTLALFDSHSYPVSISRKLHASSGCYELDFRLRPEMRVMEGWDVTEYLTYAQLLEQMRFSLGQQLKKIGDTAVFALPAPICHTLPRVFYNYRFDLKPLTLELAALSSFKNRPCALVKIRPSQSNLNLNVSGVENKPGVQIDAKLTLQAELLVALDNGQIVSATLSERVFGTTSAEGASPSQSRYQRILAFKQLN